MGRVLLCGGTPVIKVPVPGDDRITIGMRRLVGKMDGQVRVIKRKEGLTGLRARMIAEKDEDRKEARLSSLTRCSFVDNKTTNQTGVNKVCGAEAAKRRDERVKTL